MRFGLPLVLLMFAAPALAAVDLTTPKSAAKSFFEAVNAADSSAMRDCLLIDGADQEKLAGPYIEVIVSAKKLADAAREKFGVSGEKIAAGALPREDVTAIDNASQSDSGDTAALTVHKDGKPLKFRKTAGGWKLILLDYAGGKNDDLPGQVKLLSNLAAAMNDTANEVAEGRFPTPADAESAIQQRFSEVMVKRYKPATSQPKQ